MSRAGVSGTGVLVCPGAGQPRPVARRHASAYPRTSARPSSLRAGGPVRGVADEVAEYGIKVLIVEPGSFRTALFETGRRGASADSGLYSKVTRTRGFVSDGDGVQPGDPAKAAALILAALEAERTPLRLPLGDDGVTAVLGHLDQVRADVVAWEKSTRATAYDD